LIKSADHYLRLMKKEILLSRSNESKSFVGNDCLDLSLSNFLIPDE